MIATSNSGSKYVVSTQNNVPYNVLKTYKIESKYQLAWKTSPTYIYNYQWNSTVTVCSPFTFDEKTGRYTYETTTKQVSALRNGDLIVISKQSANPLLFTGASYNDVRKCVILDAYYMASPKKIGETTTPGEVVGLQFASDVSYLLNADIQSYGGESYFVERQE